MPIPLRLLIVEDSPDDAELMVLHLRDEGFQLEWQRVQTEADFLAALETNPDLILADWSLPQFSGWRALQLMQEKKLDIPFIIVSGSIGEGVAVEAMRKGATDYLLKDRLARLGQAVKLALEEKQLRDERRTAEAALRQSHELLSLFIKESPVYAFIKDVSPTECRVLYASENYRDMIGIPGSEMAGKTMEQLFPPELAAKFTADDRAVVSKGVVLNVDEDMNDRHYTTIKFPIVQGGKTLLAGYTIDITERKQAEEALRESEEKWHSLVSASPDYIALHDQEGRFLFLNRYAQGFSEKDVIGKSVYEYLLPESVEIFRNGMEKTLNTWQTQHFEYAAMGDHGTRRMYENYLVPLRDKNQEVNILVISRDITERKLAEEALHESEIRFRAFVEQAPVAIGVFNLDGKGLYINRKFMETLGLQSVEEAVGRPAYEYFAPQFRAESKERTRRRQLGLPVPDEYESVAVHADGSEFPVQLAVAPIQLSDGIASIAFLKDITDQKQAEQALYENEKRLASIYNTVGDVIFYLAVEPGGQYRFSLVNPAFGKVTGIPIEQVIGRKVNDIIPQPSLSLVLGKYRQAIEEKTIVRWEETSDYPTGRLVGEVSVSPVFDDAGTCTHLVGSVHDITDRKLAEEKTLASEARLRAVTEGTRALLVSVDANGHFIYANDATADAVGVATPQELIGKPYLHFVHPEDRQRVLDTFIKQAAARQTSCLQEFRIVDTHGNIKWFSFLSTLETKDGQITGQSGVAQDITGRKQAEEEIRRRNEDLTLLNAINAAANRGESLDAIINLLSDNVKDIFNSFGATIHLLNADRSRLVMQNLTIPKALAKGIEKTIGFSIPRVEHDLQAAHPYRQVFASGRSQLINDPEEIQKFTGAYLSSQRVTEKTRSRITRLIPAIVKLTNRQSVMVVPLVSGKEIIGTLDIGSREPFNEDDLRRLEAIAGQLTTAILRTRADEEIRQLNAELEQRVEERTLELRQAQEKIVRQEKLAVLGQLAGGVGHELRNPLGVINSAVYYLKLVQPDASGKIKQYHNMIEQEVHNSEKIISDLLDFARIESRQQEPVSVPELVQRTLTRFPVPETVKVILKLPPGLPLAFADPRQMEQVLGNLIVNAYQAMPKGGRLTISAREVKKDQVAIAVKDVGVGITPENLQKIFEPLFTTKAKGIGLGLAVSRKLAEANGGRIEVKSEPGIGSTFTLVLPVGSGSK